jgi:hypothetical protein
MAPRVVAHPEARPTETEVTVDKVESSATRRTNQQEKRLAELEEKLRHELVGDEERAELRDRVLALRRRLEREGR